MITKNVYFNDIKFRTIQTSYAKFIEERSPQSSIISNDGLDITLITSDSLRTSFVSPTKNSGKHYLEIEFTNDGTQIIGFNIGSLDLSEEYSGTGMVLFGNGNLFTNSISQPAQSVSGFYTGDTNFYGSPNVVGIAIDFDSETVFWTVNGDSTNQRSISDYVDSSGAKVSCSRTNSTRNTSFHIRTEDEALYNPNGYSYWK